MLALDEIVDRPELAHVRRSQVGVDPLAGAAHAPLGDRAAPKPVNLDPAPLAEKYDAHVVAARLVVFGRSERISIGWRSPLLSTRSMPVAQARLLPLFS